MSSTSRRGRSWRIIKTSLSNGNVGSTPVVGIKFKETQQTLFLQKYVKFCFLYLVSGAQITTLGEGRIKSRVMFIEILEGEDKRHKFGFGLSRPEQEWIVDQVNDFLSELAAAKEVQV